LNALQAGESFESVTESSTMLTVRSLELLQKLGFLVHPTDQKWMHTTVANQLYYFAALGFNPNESQENLLRSKVAIVGVGGIGTVLLSHLVGSGLSNFILIDSDVVQQSNFNRQQMFSLSDLGEYKVFAAEKWITARVHPCSVDARPIHVSDSIELSNIIQDCDMVVLAADSPVNIKYIVLEAAILSGCAFAAADCGLRSASWGPIVRGESAKNYLEEISSGKRDFSVPQPHAPMQASFSPTNTIAASFLAREVIHWLAGLSHRSDYQLHNFEELVRPRTASTSDTPHGSRAKP
jgi:sulfur-carrier protein adenylyltransferase/sulfurtransferase